MPNVFPILVSPPSAQRSTAKALKTFQTSSYATGDDGNVQRGRLVDFWTLNEANPFGNTRRFTGVTGGYQDHSTSVYYTVANVATNEAGAFPEGIRIDWALFDGSTVLGWGKSGFTTGGTFFTLVAACVGYSTATYPTGWSAPNINEYFTLKDYAATNFLAVIPFAVSITARVLSGTTDMYNSANCEYIAAATKRQLVLDKTISSVTNSMLPVRVFTVTGTTLT